MNGLTWAQPVKKLTRIFMLYPVEYPSGAESTLPSRVGVPSSIVFEPLF